MHNGFGPDGSVLNPADADKFLKAADKNIQQANQDLKKARDVFKNILAQLKTINR